MRSDWPELSDLILDVDPETLERRPVARDQVEDALQRLDMRSAARILRRLPGDPTLDPDAVDAVLLRAHCELQRLSFEFRMGNRVQRMLRPLLAVLREHVAERPLRVVDVGCGLGFVLRWLAAHGDLGDDIELLGCDFNPVLVSTAEALAREEGLRCSFRRVDAFRLDAPGHVYLSTGVLHHFRDDGLERFFAQQAGAGAMAMLHTDVKASWLAPVGAWLFHRARMREPLARHDGVLSAVRAHPVDRIVEAARGAGRPLVYGMMDGRPTAFPIVRNLNILVGLRVEIVEPFVRALGPLARRLETPR